jgi:hypothetical protein
MRFPLPIYISKHHEYRKAVKISLESIIQNFFSLWSSPFSLLSCDDRRITPPLLVLLAEIINVF